MSRIGRSIGAATRHTSRWLGLCCGFVWKANGWPVMRKRPAWGTRTALETPARLGLIRTSALLALDGVVKPQPVRPSCFGQCDRGRKRLSNHNGKWNAPSSS